MATEIDIPVAVKGEREDDAFSSEFSEGKVTEHPGNRVKQLDSRLNQAVETSSRAAETVNTQLESDKRTDDEGGIFFQALSVPVVTAAEHINTPDSCETTTEDQEDRSGAIRIETFMEEKPNDDEQVAVIAVKETDDKSVDAQEVKEVREVAASEKVESEKEVKLSDSSNMKLEEKATTILNKDDDEEKEQEVNMSEKSQGEDNIISSRDVTFESSVPELVETKEITEKDIQEIEYNATTQTESEERTPKNEEKNDEAVTGSDDDQMKNSGSLVVKEVCEEVVLKKVESEEVSKLPDVSSMASNENVTASKEDQEKLYVSEKGQGGGDDVTSSENASSEFIKETTTAQHATTPAYLEEGEDLNAMPKDILKEGDDRTTDPQEASQQSENGARNKSEQKPVEIEQEEQTEVIRQIDEIDEKLEQKGMLRAITTDTCISEQTKSQVETTEHEQKDDQEEATESDDGRKEKSDIPTVKEVCEEATSEKVEFEKEVQLSNSSSMKIEEKATTILNKDDDQEKEQEVNMSDKSQGEDNITSSRDLTFESSEPELVETKEITEKDTQEIEYHATTPEKTERLIHAVPTDVCISTPTEPEEKTPENEEKNEEEVTGSDDDQTKMSESLVVKEVCEEVVPKKVESEEVTNLPDNSSMVLNENVIASKEDQDKLYVSDEGQGGGDDAASSQNASSEFIKETTTSQHATAPAYLEEGEDLNATPKDILKEEGDDRTTDPQEESEQCENEAKDKREKKQEESVNIVHSSLEIEQEDDIEEIKRGGEKLEQQGSLHDINADGSNSTQTESHEENAENEVNNEEATIENEIVSKDEYQEKEQEVYTSETGQCGGDDVTSSQDASSEDIKEMIGQHATKVAYFEEVQGLNAMAKEIQKEDATDRIIVPQEASEQYENGANDKTEQMPEDIMHSCLESEQEEHAKDIKPNVATEIKEEQEELMCISAQTETRVESQLEATEREEEVIESDDGPKEKSNNPSITEACEEINTGKVEYEGVEVSDNSGEKLNEKAIAILSKDEDQENEQELNMLEENQGEEKVTCPREASSKKDLEGKNYDGEHIELELIENRESIKKDIEVIRTNVDTEEIKEQQGSLSAIVTDVCMSEQTEPKEETTKSEESTESNDWQKERLVIPCVNEACEETGLEAIDAQEASERYENGAKNIKEQDLAGIDEATSKEDETYAGNKKEEAYFENSNFEAGKAGEGTEGGTENISPENKDGTIADESKSTENPCTTEQDILEEVGEKTTVNSEEITKQAFQESQRNKEIEAKLEAENQAGGREDRSEMNDEVVLTKKVSLELGQPVEQNVEEIQASKTTIMSEKIEDGIAEKNEDLSALGSIEEPHDNTIKEEKSFLDERTREIEISTFEHEPVGEKITMKPEEITKHAFQESQSQTNVEIEAKFDAENQVDEREDKSEIKDEVVLTEKVSSELEQPMEQNVEEIQACRTTAISEKKDDIAETVEELSLGSREDTNDYTIIEEKSFPDGRTREIEVSTLKHERVGEKTAIKPEEITKQATEESKSETNKEIEARLDVENQVDESEDKSEMKDEIVLTEKMSLELEQPMEQNAEEIQACLTTTVSGKIEDEIVEKDEDVSLGSIEDTKDNIVKEEESFLDEKTREIDISTLENEHVGENNTMKLEEITKQTFQESQSETIKEIEAKLEAENQGGEREDRNEMKDEVALTEKMSSELDVEEIQACQTTTMSEEIADDITEKNEDLSMGNREDKNENIVKEEKSFVDGKTREIEISTLEHEPIEEKTAMKSEQNSKQGFQEAKLDVENLVDEREDRKEMKDEVVLTEKTSLELEQPMKQNVEEIQACQTTAVSGKIEDDITEKNEDLSFGNREDKDDNTIEEGKNILDEKTREIDISTLENEHVGEKTSMKLEEITKQAFQESQIETNKEIEAKLDAENQADKREDRSEIKDEVLLTEKMSSELGQPMEQNVEEIQTCRTTTMCEKIEDDIGQKNEDLSLGGREEKDENTVKEEKSFLNGKTREIEISTLEHEPIGEKTTIEPEDITKQGFQESQSETNKEIEAKLDAKSQVDEREDKSELKDEIILTEKMSSELGQPMEQNVEEIQACQTKNMSEKTEDEIVENEDFSHDSREDTNENTSNEEKSFLDGRTREIEISTLEHESLEEKNGGLDEVSTKKHTDLNEATTVELQEDLVLSRSPGTSTEDAPNSENPKAESENLPIEDLDSVSEVQIPRVVPKSEDSAKATSVDKERGTAAKEILSDEISYSDPIPVEDPEVTEAVVDAQIEQEDLQAAEDINCESKASSGTQAFKKDMNEDAEKSVRISEEVENDGVDEAPKQVGIPTLEDAATLEPQVNLSNVESTYPSESDKSPTQALESVCDVQTPEVVADLKESRVKEEHIDLATTEYTDENNGEEEQETKTNEISSEEKKEQTTECKQVVDPHSMLSPDAVLIEENLERHGELKPTSELMIDQVGETKPQPEQSDITSEQVVVETEKEEGSTEVKQQDFEEDNCPKELEKTSTSNQKELANEIEFSKSIPIGNTEVAEVKAESERELKNIPEDLSCLSKASSTAEVKDDSIDEASRIERIPNLEDVKALELQVNLPDIVSIGTPSNDQDDMKLRESMLIEQKGVLSSQLTDREILEEETTENRKEAPNHEFEKEEKDDQLISESQTPEAILKMEIKEEHVEATNDSCETLTGGLPTEKKLVSMVPPEELTSPKAEDQTNELASETDKAKVEHSSVSSKDWNPEVMEEKFTKTLSEDQRSTKEQFIEEEGQDNFGAKNKEAKSGNEVVEDVIVNEVLLEVEKAKESDNINKEGSFIPNQLTSATDEICQIKRLDSSPNELLEVKGSVEDIGDPKLMAETFTVMKGPDEDMKQNVEKTSEAVASEFESPEKMVTEEKMIEANANEEKKTLEDPQADDPAKTTSDSISSSTEQDKEAKSEEISGHSDMHKLEEEPTEVFELTSEVDEIVAKGKEVSAMSTENLQEASPEMLLVKHDPETTSTIDKSEEEIKDKDETLVNVDFSTSSKEVACLSNEKTGELQVSTLNAEIYEGKQDGLIDMLNKEREAVQPQEHISDIKSVDPPSDVEIKEQGGLMHHGSQESSEDNTLLSQNDKKTADFLVVPSVQKEITQDVEKRCEEAPAIDNQKHENDLDYTAKATTVDVVSNAECPEIEQHLDKKEATVEPINQEIQSEQKKEEDENIESEIPIEKVPEQTAAHEEIANEVLVMPVAKEEEKLHYLQDSKEQEYSEGRTYPDLEDVKEPSQTDKLSDEAKKAEPIDIQDKTMAEGILDEEETEKRTNITEETVNLHHREKGDETNCKATSTEAAIPIEYVKSSDVVKGDLDASVPKCASTRNPEVRSAILEVLSVMDATDDKASYNKDPNNKTAEAHVAEKGVLKEDVHLESTCNIIETTEKVSGTNQEPLNLPFTKERGMELDAATKDMENSQKCVADDLVKVSQIQPELQTYEASARDVDKQLPEKPYQNDSVKSKLVTGAIDASHEQGEPTAKSLKASGTEPQCSSEVVKEEKKISDEKEKSEAPDRAKIVCTDTLHESTQGSSEVAENSIEEREPAPTKDQQVDKEETGDNGAKTDEEDEAEEDDEDNQKIGSCSDAPVMVEASKDMEVKVPKKSHNILSGVGSKVKHSIAKVKKAITGKSSSPKPPSPKGRD